jgi:hypothetical protein
MFREQAGRLESFIRELAAKALAPPAGQTRLRLNLPNLQVTAIIPPPSPTVMSFSAGIANVGPAPAGPFDAVATVRFAQPPGGVAPAPLTLTTRVPGVAPGQTRGVDFGPETIRHSTPPVSIEVCADPPTAERPAGEIVESNNEDNCFLLLLLSSELPPGEPGVPSEDQPSVPTYQGEPSGREPPPREPPPPEP